MAAVMNRQTIPRQFEWPMWAAVWRSWCLLMLPVLPGAWFLPLQEFVSLFVLASVLVLIAIYDMRYGLIYDRLVAWLLLLGIVPLLSGHVGLSEACAGALLGSGLLGALRWLSGGGLGLGDVKLALPLGVWLGWEDMIFCLLLSSVAGLLYGSALIFGHRLQRQSPLPFGPFLALGAIAAFVWGADMRCLVEAWLW